MARCHITVNCNISLIPVINGGSRISFAKKGTKMKII